MASIKFWMKNSQSMPGVHFGLLRNLGEVLESSENRLFEHETTNKTLKAPLDSLT